MTMTPFTNPQQLFEDYQNARNAKGLTWSDQLGGWVVARHEDILVALDNPDVFSSAPLAIPFTAELERYRSLVPDKGTLIGYDNPDHDRLRQSVNTFFMPRNLKKFESWIEEAAHRIIDDFYEDGVGDLRELLTSPLPMQAICHIVGVDVDNWRSHHAALMAFTQMSADTFHLVLDFHDYLRRVINERKAVRRDDLISHIWNLRDSGQVEMTDHEMLGMFPGLMLAGHETSSNLMITALTHMLARPGLYERVQASTEMRTKAIEEAIRYEAPISGMPRVSTRDFDLGGTLVRQGEQVFLAYSSGNRDACRYADAENFDLERELTINSHIGFAQGIHTCLGAPLARLLLGIELRVIGERLPGLRAKTTYQDRTYIPVGPIRALIESEFAWEVVPRRAGYASAAAATPYRAGWIDAEVVAKTEVADGAFEIALVTHETLVWRPGAHITIELKPGLVRQYSLVETEATPQLLAVCVSVRDLRGQGSQYVQRDLRVGSTIRVRQPKNNFAFEPNGKPAYFLAAGIGVTPIKSLAKEASNLGLLADLTYLGKAEEAMPYSSGLRAELREDLRIWESETRGRFNLRDYVETIPAGSALYACGPMTLLNELAYLCEHRDIDLHVERFEVESIPAGAAKSFTATLAKSGRTIQVGESGTLLEALATAGVPVASSCKKGTCGTCEVRVLSGRIDHRDVVLSAEDRLAGETIISCVSRAADADLTLDL